MTGRRGERGMALVSVLWTLVILSLIAAGTLTLGTVSYRIGRNMEDRANGEALAEAGIYRAILALRDQRPGLGWKADGGRNLFSFAGSAIAISIRDEAGKTDLNAADEDALTTLFVSGGEPQDRAAAFAGQVIAWRGEAPFQRIEELRLVPGVTSALYERLEPSITLYSRLPRPDDAHSVISAGLGLAVSPLGRAFSITAEAPAGQPKATRRAVILLTGDARRPYLVLSWR